MMKTKETVIQFGEGGFLRGFIDYFFDVMQKKGLYDGKVVIVQPIPKGRIDDLNAQGCVYHQIFRGIQNCNRVDDMRTINSISRAINPYTEYDAYLKLAHNPDMKVIISNTTEAGIEYNRDDVLDDTTPRSYPGKLTMLLYERYKAGLDGFLILPCELIDKNGDNLKSCIHMYIKLWKLGDDFDAWIDNNNKFSNTLVDRICTGYPVQEAEEICKKNGFEDKLLNVSEIFHLWVLEGNYEDILPLQHAGLNIVWTEDVTPYKKRKVRILNGAHTSMVLIARLCGLDNVGECMHDSLMRKFIDTAVFGEIIPTLGNSETDIQFGKDVMERFENPFVRHRLLSIALNSVSKFGVRVLPTIDEYLEKNHELPKLLTLSLAGLIAFYQTDEVDDSAEVVERMRCNDVKTILSDESLWGKNLSYLYDAVSDYYEQIKKKGMKQVVEEACTL